MLDTKECEVVMLPNLERDLPTERWSEWKITLDNNKLDYKKYVHSTGFDIYQNLYFISDEEIKEGDWFIANQGVRKCMAIDEDDKMYPYITFNEKNEKIKHFHTWKTKVVASTDPSLGLPSIPEKWILTKYVPSSGKIDKVRLEEEYREFLGEALEEMPHNYYCKLKLTPNNEVVIVDSFVQLEQPDCDKQAIAEEIMAVTKDFSPVKPTVDQEFEDAILKMYPNKNEESHLRAAARQGANWQKERCSNEAVEFLDWTSLQGYRYIQQYPCKWIKGNNFQEEITSKELYRRWNQRKIK